ncbi:glycosyltransferase family 4 protein [Calothrix sp. 336/3]|uniref:glycosyltransferase family 4 protein n=1 Tax=Calothrix sp. 336/3 TaxID=1337936 RepID=UPI0004E3C2F6|nr:glycosyltransferase family 4 protein [Calothrix sp. 336/3]AKG24080.1 glycosyl transferase family 1 [Calothrix sp. 336/3]
MRTLFITKEVPYPTIGGVSLRTWQNINIMMKSGEVGVFSVSNWTPKHTSLPGVAVWKHCNVTEKRSPKEQFINRLWWFSPRKHPDTLWGYSHATEEALNQLLQEFKPDIVILEEIWVYPYLQVVKNHPCKIIFDNHNVEASLWEQRHSNSNNWKFRLRNTIHLAHLKRIEKDFISQVNQVWMCSEEDVHLLKKFYLHFVPTYAVPNSINVSAYDSIRSGEFTPPPELANNPYNLLFLGQLSYSPNTVAAELLIQKIFPEIQKIYPQSRLLLVGRTPTAYMLEAAAKNPHIIVTGSVPDVKPYIAAASIMVVPLMQGGGTRLKIVEAFAAGCPVISTAKGCEGIKAKDGEELLIRNTVSEIVAGIQEIWSDSYLGEKLANSAYELVQKEYSWEATARKIDQAIHDLLHVS